MPERLACIGNLTIDEAVLPGGMRMQSVGGDALFAVLAARIAGAETILCAPLGCDVTPELQEALQVAGADPQTLPRRRQATIRNVVRYDELGGRTWELVYGEEHFELMSVHPADVGDAVLAADGVLVSGMALHSQLELAHWLRAHTAAVIYFDPQEDYIAGNEAALHRAIGACDVFLPSEVEAAALAGTTDPAAAAAFFLTLGPGTVVIKRAEAGALVVTRELPQPVIVPAEVVDSADSTGAGDAFCGAFAAEHLHSADAYAAARVGAAAARAAVSARGVTGLLAALNNSQVRR